MMSNDGLVMHCINKALLENLMIFILYNEDMQLSTPHELWNMASNCGVHGLEMLKSFAD